LQCEEEQNMQEASKRNCTKTMETRFPPRRKRRFFQREMKMKVGFRIKYKKDCQLHELLGVSNAIKKFTQRAGGALARLGALGRYSQGSLPPEIKQALLEEIKAAFEGQHE
jgi:hypothetical protein